MSITNKKSKKPQEPQINSVVVGATMQGGPITSPCSPNKGYTPDTGKSSNALNIKDSDLQVIIDKDPSAHEQGRKALGWRKRGEQVNPKFMTPKEYTHFIEHSIDDQPIWDGIERKFMRLNWEPWDWGKSAKENLPLVNRRYRKERRKPWSISTGYERRKPRSHGQRYEDVMSHKIRVITLSICFTILGTLTLLSILKYNGVIN